MTSHVPDAKVHWFKGEKAPVPLDEANVTAPPGASPFTVTWHEVDDCTLIVTGVQETEITLDALATERYVAPVLPLLFESPPYVAEMVAVIVDDGI